MAPSGDPRMARAVQMCCLTVPQAVNYRCVCKQTYGDVQAVVLCWSDDVGRAPLSYIRIQSWMR